jgi:hypothetical protein
MIVILMDEAGLAGINVDLGLAQAEHRREA